MAASDTSPASAPVPGPPEPHLLVGWTLLAGLVTSVAVMLLGLLLVAVRGTQNAAHVLPLDQVWSRLMRGDPAAVLDLGILLLFATPLVGVVTALAGFALERDFIFVAFAVALLVILAAGFAVALR